MKGDLGGGIDERDGKGKKVKKEKIDTVETPLRITSIITVLLHCGTPASLALACTNLLKV